MGNGGDMEESSGNILWGKLKKTHSFCCHFKIFFKFLRRGYGEGGIVGLSFKEIGGYYVWALILEQWLLRKSILSFGIYIVTLSWISVYLPP